MLDRPERGYGAAFYEEVAAAYRAALRSGQRPVTMIANEAGVPHTTAARWVKQARRRGSLNPALRRGKAGELLGKELHAAQ